MRNLMGCFLLVAACLKARSAQIVSADDAAIARAMASVEKAIPRAQADPTRPAYHFRPPALWMNDPNGPIYFHGYFHLFYQTNPYGDTWGHMHWGHARSRDLVRWEHLPIALAPSESLGEEHVFSGCVVIARNQPMIFYTSIHQGQPAETSAEQWAALGDKDLLRWEKLPDNPVLSEQAHGGTKIYDWRDPFIFQQSGSTYMVLGGNLNARKGGQAVVNLYRAQDDSLARWQYVGILFQHPDSQVGNIECPNFFPLGNRWVLIVSPHGPVEAFIGDFDAASGKFHARDRSILDLGGRFYAPNSLAGPHGRRILWGWVNGFPKDRGWNGALSLPRVLSLSPKGELLQKPPSELKKLRGDHFRLSDVTLEKTNQELAGVRGDCLELYLDVELLGPDPLQLLVRRSADGSRSVAITYSGNALEVGDLRLPFVVRPEEKTLQLRVFLDKSMLELFANDRLCCTKVLEAQPDDLGVALSSVGSPVRVRSFHAWKMRSIW